MVSPTPGEENVGETTSYVMPSPVFSVPGGVYSSPVQLTISAPEDIALPRDAVLCVTTDGREPSISDMIGSLSLNLSIDESTTVRAKLLSSQFLNPLSVTHSYIFDSTKMPVISITTDPDYLYSAEMGIFHGIKGQNPNYENDWRRPINIEFFMPGE